MISTIPLPPPDSHAATYSSTGVRPSFWVTVDHGRPVQPLLTLSRLRLRLRFPSFHFPLGLWCGALYDAYVHVLCPAVGPVSDRACKYKYSWFVFGFLFGNTDDKRLAKNIPAGCIVRFSVTGKSLRMLCVDFNGILIFIVLGRIFHESWVYGSNWHGDHRISFARSRIFSIVRTRWHHSTRLHQVCLHRGSGPVSDRACTCLRMYQPSPIDSTDGDDGNRLVKNNHSSAPQAACSSGDTGMFLLITVNFIWLTFKLDSLLCIHPLSPYLTPGPWALHCDQSSKWQSL